MRRLILSALCALALTGGLAVPATAEPPSGEGAERGGPAAVGTTTETVTLSDGEQFIATSTVGRPQVATAADLAVDGDLAATGGGPTLAEAAAQGSSIYYRSWSQTMSAIVPFLWNEKHEGKYYWDKTYVWATVTYRGYQGYHHCNIGSGIGFIVQVFECHVWGGEPKTGGDLEQWDRFKVSAVSNGVPVWTNHAMHTNIYPSGNIYWHVEY